MRGAAPAAERTGPTRTRRRLMSLTPTHHCRGSAPTNRTKLERKVNNSMTSHTTKTIPHPNGRRLLHVRWFRTRHIGNTFFQETTPRPDTLAR